MVLLLQDKESIQCKRYNEGSFPKLQGFVQFDGDSHLETPNLNHMFEYKHCEYNEDIKLNEIYTTYEDIAN